MKNYYLYKNDVQCGPFTIEELVEQGLTGNTAVWTEGMQTWTTASQLPELRQLIKQTPPPFISETLDTYATAPPVMTLTEKTGNRIGRLLGWPGLVILAGAIIAILLYFNKNSSATTPGSSKLAEEIIRTKTPQELRAELLSRERNDPESYIDAKFSHWENLISERVVQIQFSNRATLANYKDITVRVHFLTQTKTELGVTNYTIHKYLPAGNTMDHKMKLQQPSGTKDISISIVGAVSNN